MTLDADLALSYYKELTVIHPDHHISIVQHVESGQIYIKKEMAVYHEEVYRKLQKYPIKGIPEIHELIKSNGHLVLIEQYIAGKTLEDYIHSEPLDDDFIYHTISSLCGILRQLHSLNPPVIHRDIKPSNIMISPQGELWLLDFNAAKPFSSQKDSDTLLIGTHGYAAPEQYGFAPSSPQTDIFAIGMVIKDLAEASKLKTHRFDNIILNCTRLDPKDRYSSVSELLKALNHPSGQSVLFRVDKPAEERKKAVQTSASEQRQTTVSPATLSSENSAKSPRTEVRGWKSFLLPGLASRYILVRILSVIGYFLLVLVCLRTNFDDALPFANWIERILEFFLFLVVVLPFTNYKNIRRLMPLCSNRNRLTRYIGVVLLAVILFVFVFFLMMVVIIIWHVPKV